MSDVTTIARQAAKWCAMVAWLAGPAVFAAGQAPDGSDPLSRYTAMTEQELRDLRGGFVTAEGLEVLIGVDRLLYVNGELQMLHSLDLSNLPHGDAAQVRMLVGNNGLIQLGPGNTVSPELQALIASGALGVIQNSLNDQLITNITQLNIRVHNFAERQSLTAGQLLNFQVTGAMR